jgi:hypothetical protein
MGCQQYGAVTASGSGLPGGLGNPSAPTDCAGKGLGLPSGCDGNMPGRGETGAAPRSVRPRPAFGGPAAARAAERDLPHGQSRTRPVLHRARTRCREPRADLWRSRFARRGVRSRFHGPRQLLAHVLPGFFDLDVWGHDSRLRRFQRAAFRIPTRVCRRGPAIPAVRSGRGVGPVRVFQVRGIPRLPVGAGRVPARRPPAPGAVHRHHGHLGSLVPRGTAERPRGGMDALCVASF